MTKLIMLGPGLAGPEYRPVVPGIDVPNTLQQEKAWAAATSPAMTRRRILACSYNGLKQLDEFRVIRSDQVFLLGRVFSSMRGLILDPLIG
jgi:hypothetical protein